MGISVRLVLNTASCCLDCSLPLGVSSSVFCLFCVACVFLHPPVIPFCELISEVVLPYKSFSCPGFGNLSGGWAELLWGLFLFLSRAKEFAWVSSGRGWGSSAYLWTSCPPPGHCPNSYPSTIPPENRYSFSLNQGGGVWR